MAKDADNPLKMMLYRTGMITAHSGTPAPISQMIYPVQVIDGPLVGSLLPSLVDG